MTDQPPKQPETGPKTKRLIDTSGWHRPDVLDLDYPNCLLVDVPQDFKANILVIRYPVVTETKGGLILDHRSYRHPECLAFVIKSSTWPIERGDTILCPEHQYTLEIKLEDQETYMLDLRDVGLHYPDPKNPLDQRQPPNNSAMGNLCPEIGGSGMRENNR